MVNQFVFFCLLLSILLFFGCAPNAQVVKNQAENKEMIKNAPIEAMRSLIINAPIQKIWKILIDVDDWPNWYHFLSGSRISGKFEAGSKIEYGGFFKHRLTIGVVEPPKTVALYGALTWAFKALPFGKWINYRKIRPESYLRNLQTEVYCQFYIQTLN